MKAVLLLLLRGYKLAISPMLGQNCRFYPSCSEYAAEAIREYGALRGSWMAGKRLCKCHPWHPGGVDLVPCRHQQDQQIQQIQKHDGHENNGNAPISEPGSPQAPSS